MKNESLVRVRIFIPDASLSPNSGGQLFIPFNNEEGMMEVTKKVKGLNVYRYMGTTVLTKRYMNKFSNPAGYVDMSWVKINRKFK